MNNLMIPEQRSLNNESSYWKRVKENGNIECFNKEFYNSDFTEKESIEEKLLKKIDIELKR